jgi:hypothetical protein
MDGEALRFEGDSGHRKPGTDPADQSHTGCGGTGRAVGEPFAGSSHGVELHGSEPGVAVLARELAGLSWPAIHLGALRRDISGVKPRWQSFEALPRNLNLFRRNPKI